MSETLQSRKQRTAFGGQETLLMLMGVRKECQMLYNGCIKLSMKVETLSAEQVSGIQSPDSQESNYSSLRFKKQMIQKIGKNLFVVTNTGFHFLSGPDSSGRLESVGIYHNDLSQKLLCLLQETVHCYREMFQILFDQYHKNNDHFVGMRVVEKRKRVTKTKKTTFHRDRSIINRKCCVDQIKTP